LEKRKKRENSSWPRRPTLRFRGKKGKEGGEKKTGAGRQWEERRGREGRLLLESSFRETCGEKILGLAGKGGGDEKKKKR